MGGRQRILDGRYLILPPYKFQKLVLKIGVVNVGRGGELWLALPPRPRRRLSAPQAPGLSNTRYKHKKKRRKIIVESLWVVRHSDF
jgi:hypothetical protein